MVTGSTNAFLTWFAEWGQIVYFIAQMLFWVAIAAAALVVALQYRRLVSFKVGDTNRVKEVEPAPEVFAE